MEGRCKERQKHCTRTRCGPWSNYHQAKKPSGASGFSKKVQIEKWSTIRQDQLQKGSDRTREKTSMKPLLPLSSSLESCFTISEHLHSYLRKVQCSSEMLLRTPPGGTLALLIPEQPLLGHPRDQPEAVSFIWADKANNQRSMFLYLGRQSK